MVVEAARADAAGLGDRADGEALIARSGVHAQGGIQDLFDGGLATLLLGAHRATVLGCGAGGFLMIPAVTA